MTDPGPARADADALMQRRLERERAARKAAEELLLKKSSELYESVQSARDAERRLQLALWASGEGIWEWDVAQDRFAIDGLEVQGRAAAFEPCSLTALLALVDPLDREAVQLAFRLYVRSAREDIDTAFRVPMERAGAVQHRWLRIRGRALARDADGRPERVTGTIKDVTSQREAEHSLRLMAQAFASTHDALVVVDARGGIVQANEPFAALLDEPAAAFEGRAWSSVAQLGGAVPLAGAWHGELALQSAGRVRHLEITVTPVQAAAAPAPGDEPAAPACFIVALRDVSERRRAEEALRRQVLRDTLTGLPNRAGFTEALERRLGRPEEHPFSLMFIDLDGFKEVNDGFGHAAGDALLRQCAQRMSAALPKTTVGRWGGDEFVLLLGAGSTRAHAAATAALLIEKLGQPYDHEGHALIVTPSIGTATFPDDGREGSDLLRCADLAMYAAKQRGRNCAVAFHPELDAGHERRVLLQQLLRVDARRDGFHFLAQPKVDAHGEPVGAELLMRWNTGPFGAVSPAEFIPLAEQIGVIDRMGRYALRTAARMAATLDLVQVDLGVAVNLSPRQLLHEDLERTLLETCRAHRADPQRIELELTESALVTDIGQVTTLLRRLAGHGFRLALDDFGTGYSSLSHLRDLPFHKVKIDRSFVIDLERDPRSALMLEGVVRLCKSLGLQTTAEGVETQAQFDRLREYGIDEFQGYLFARPMQLDAWVESVCARESRFAPAD
jgi:diguanylate cyclase (GGDEF)-like protein